MNRRKAFDVAYESHGQKLDSLELQLCYGFMGVNEDLTRPQFIDALHHFIADMRWGGLKHLEDVARLLLKANEEGHDNSKED